MRVDVPMMDSRGSFPCARKNGKAESIPAYCSDATMAHAAAISGTAPYCSGVNSLVMIGDASNPIMAPQISATANSIRLRPKRFIARPPPHVLASRTLLAVPSLVRAGPCMISQPRQDRLYFSHGFSARSSTIAGKP